MTTATILAIVAIGLFGLLFGIVLAIMGAMAYAMYTASVQQREATKHAHETIMGWIRKQNEVIGGLRSDVTIALSKFDGDRLHDASLAIQSSSKQLNQSVATFSKLLFAQAGANPTVPLAGFPQPQMSEAFGLEDERMDDEYLNSQASRWGQSHGQVGWAGVQQQVPMQYQQDQYNPAPPPEPRRPFGMPASPMTQWPRAAEDPQPASLPDIEGAYAAGYQPGEVGQSVFDTLATPPHQGDMSQ